MVVKTSGSPVDDGEVAGVVEGEVEDTEDADEDADADVDEVDGLTEEPVGDETFTLETGNVDVLAVVCPGVMTLMECS